MVFLSGDDFKCGCMCTQCCPKWAMTASPNNYTADGKGSITVINMAAFGKAIVGAGQGS